MLSNMFGGEKVRPLTPRTPCPPSSTVVLVLWGYFAANGTGAFQRVNGTMKEDYLQILQGKLKSSAPRLGRGHSWMFQQDNDPKQTSKVAMEWLNQVRIRVLEWPSQSPDFKPIENMWSMLKKQLHVRKPSNLTELHWLCQEEWSKIQPEACGWLPKVPDWNENGQGTCHQTLALLDGYFWPSRFCHFSC